MTLLLASLIITDAPAQKYIFDLQEINVKDGLPARQVFDIAQGKDDFIWISTRLGIHRFDGYSFKSYDNVFLNLPDQNPANIVIDEQNFLWYSKWKLVSGQ